MSFGELKPFLATLLLPPAGPLLLAFLGLLIAGRWFGRLVIALALGVLWLLSCNAVAIATSNALLPGFAPVRPAELASEQVQAIVVLGGGVLPHAPEFGAAQPSANTAARLRYGVYLARQTGRPLVFSGGVGWASVGTATPREAEVARDFLRQDHGIALRLAEGESRDTHENARQLRLLLQREGLTRIALVTDAWHMPRSVLEFERAGFDVTPAPTGFIAARERPELEWLPSAHGLAASRQVLREWLALQMATP